MLSQEHFKTGEEIAEFLAQKLAVKIEDVRSPEDVQRVQKKYLERGEISFGQIEIEFRNSDIDAVTIKRENASDDANDKYVAVLNHQEDGSRAYFSIKHELVHCFAEPPQRDLFHRHRGAKKNRLEAIVDAVAAKIAFYEPVFAPLVASYEGNPLSWNTIDEINGIFAKTASCMSIVIGTVNLWSDPVILLEGELRKSKSRPKDPAELRVSVKSWNQAATRGSVFFPQSMRVPKASGSYASWQTGDVVNVVEELRIWNTSGGTEVGQCQAFFSTKRYNNGILALVSPMLYT